MNALKTACSRLIKLFIDDTSFTAWVVLWVLTACWLLPRLGTPASWNAPILYVGLLVLLAGGVRRATRLKQR